jgi:hypothetical protein
LSQIDNKNKYLYDGWFRGTVMVEAGLQGRTLLERLEFRFTHSGCEAIPGICLIVVKGGLIWARIKLQTA